MRGVRRVPYRLPELLAAVKAGKSIVIPEGEKDVDRLLSEGHAATTSAEGAGREWKSEWCRMLVGASEVVVIADQDSAGFKHARDVFTSLRLIDYANVRLALPAPTHKGADYSDHADAGGTVDTLIPVSIDDLTSDKPSDATLDDDDDGIVLASSYEKKRLLWLWPGRIPAGKVTMLDGDPGKGKSLITVDLAVRLTTGRPLPGATAAKSQPRGVVMICAEDDWEDTIVARLEAAGANLDLVATITLKRDDKGNVIPMMLPDDLDRVRRAVEKVDAALVIIDPIMAYLGEKTNSINDSSVRQALLPLKELASDTGAAVVLVRHLNKDGALKAEYRGGGSIGFIALARSGLVVERHPHEDRNKRIYVLAQAKANLAAAVPGLTYHVEVRVDEDGDEVPVLAWGEEIEIDLETLLKGPDARKSSPEWDACWVDMQKLFAECDPMPVKDMQTLLTENGHAPQTIKRAKADHHVGSFRLRAEDGKTIAWMWTFKQEPGF